MSEATREKALDGFPETVHEPSKPSSCRWVRNDVVTDALIERIEAMHAAGERLDGVGAAMPGEAAIARVERNRAARLRFAATEADRAERLKGEPVEHRPRGEIGPTAATKARLPMDVLRRLFNHGHLDQDQLLAASEIRDVFEAVVRDLLPRAGRFGLGGAGRTAFVPSIERLPAKLSRSYVHVYLPWAKAFGDRRWRVRKGGKPTPVRISPLEVVIAIVIDNETVDEVSGRLRLREATARGVVIAMLSEALADYAERAAAADTMEIDSGRRVSA